ncbi:dimethylaniline monooxygenase [Aureobasidium pullulans]|uniref:Dimethylaniline monooxygenase n=1 Tax=Aureobasidium pullulans TaxID=5580 RepID=A0A4S9K7D4_AURPU|nr:dimethylaniline monooxygenase [Aureobasidium pullulans]
MDVKTVAIIGAGVSGVSSAIHLKNAGLEVTVFERGDVAGGVWVYNDRTAVEPSYPSTIPSTGDSPAFDTLLKTTNRGARRDSPVDQDSIDAKTSVDNNDLEILHAPPGPCYIGLHNNVSTPEMKLRTHEWPPQTPDFVTHDVLATYIQDTAAANDVLSNIKFRTRVDKVEKRERKWEVQSSKLVDGEIERAVQDFDALIVASGHYHAPNVPDYPNLPAWKSAFPSRITHSKVYRSPTPFAGKNVLVIGAGVSSTDICRELGSVAAEVWQSSRGGEYDLLPSMLPENCTRVSGIAGFSPLSSTPVLDDTAPIPGSILLSSGEELNNIHHVILATGYHMSYPFLPHLHDDNATPEHASEEILVTTGQITHNLHKDIFYIPDPTLAFIGVPYHVATFSLFEFQAMCVAAVFSGSSTLPQQQELRKEYQNRIDKKGIGRALHSLKDDEGEIGYVREMVAIVNQGRKEGEKVEGHSKEWFEAYGRRLVRMKETRGRKGKVEVEEEVAGPPEAVEN